MLLLLLLLLYYLMILRSVVAADVAAVYCAETQRGRSSGHVAERGRMTSTRNSRYALEAVLYAAQQRFKIVLNTQLIGAQCFGLADVEGRWLGRLLVLGGARRLRRQRWLILLLLFGLLLLLKLKLFLVLQLTHAELFSFHDHVLEALAAVGRASVQAGVARADQVAD